MFAKSNESYFICTETETETETEDLVTGEQTACPDVSANIIWPFELVSWAAELRLANN